MKGLAWHLVNEKPNLQFHCTWKEFLCEPSRHIECAQVLLLTLLMATVFNLPSLGTAVVHALVKLSASNLNSI
jgi:hypothetical protein